MTEKPKGRPSAFKKAPPGSVLEQEYSPSHPELLLQLMSEGKLDCEIYAALGIKKDTFYRWRREQEDFLSAFELGLPRCEAWWVAKMRQCFLDGDDKGFKYCIAIMNNKFSWGKDETARSLTQNTINIQGNMQVINQKSQQELIEMLQSDISYLELNNVIKPKIIDVTPNGSDE